MSETVNQEAATNEAAEQKTFTQAELDEIVSERLKRERSKYEGYEELKSKAAKFDELEEASKIELQKATERAEKLKAELDSMKKSEELRQIKEKVAKETGVPSSLLTGETEDACNEQAKAILAFANPTGYPNLTDGGEISNAPKGTTKQQFAEWANSALG